MIFCSCIAVLLITLTRRQCSCQFINLAIEHSVPQTNYKYGVVYRGITSVASNYIHQSWDGWTFLMGGQVGAQT